MNRIGTAVEYRTALEAPVEVAAALLTASSLQTTPPLWEVVAARFTWRELAPHLPRSTASVYAAQTRVLLGEDLSGAAEVGEVLSGHRELDQRWVGAPYALQSWEADGWVGAAALPHYSEHGFARLSCARGAADPQPMALPAPEHRPPPTEPRAAAESALREVLPGWGLTAVAVIPGTALSAIAAVYELTGDALTPEGCVEATPLEPGEAFATLLDNAAGGVFDVPYRGLAVGRLVTWRALAALAFAAHTRTTPDDDPAGSPPLAPPPADPALPPADPAQLSAFMVGTRWLRWSVGGGENELGLAGEDPRTGLGWALAGRTLAS